MAGTLFWQALLTASPDAILVVADAGDVARHLPLVLACRDLGLPIVVALNLSDEAAGHGIRGGRRAARPAARGAGAADRGPDR